MATIYGMTAVEVEQPNAELVPYPVRAVPADPGSWRCWEVTSPAGDVHRVRERPDGSWACGCKDFLFRARRNRTRPSGSICKHGEAVKRWLAERGEAGHDDALRRRGPPDAG